jgi:diketogulonate reductase-like aldo/keto reductase
MILEETYTLSNGVTIPKLGLGMWLINQDDAARVVVDALRIGYRHIDTAQAYGNEAGVGEGLRASGLARGDVFVTSKLAAEIKSYDAAVVAIDESLSTSGVDYLDLMLIHSPQPWGDFNGDDRYFDGNREAWRALEAAYTAGKVRAIGVSNFQRADIDNITATCDVAPMVNQILVHITNTPTDLIEYSRERAMLVEAYSPIGHGGLLNNEHLAAVASKYGVTVPQLSIRYTLQLGLVSLPKSSNADHIRTNAEVDFEISDEDMATLRDLDRIDYGEHAKFPVFGGGRR